MLENIKSHFDDFTFHAKVMPVLVLFLPVLVLGVYNGILLDKVVENLVLLSIVIIFLTFTSKVGRELGKTAEEKMYTDLGQKPTTILLRYSDDTIDVVTKTRYHKALNEFVPELKLPLNKKDEKKSTDSMYASAINSLRIYANSNRDKEPRVYQELKEYNFWRNLYGVKSLALVVYICLGIREIVLVEEFNIKHIFSTPYPHYIALIIMSVSIIFLCCFVNKKTVKRKAFDYAKALIEVSEGLG